MNRIAIVSAALLAFAALLNWQGAWPRPAFAIGGYTSSVIANDAKPITSLEAKKLERYLRHVLAQPEVRLVHVSPDAEVFVGEQFLGWIYADDDREGRTFYFELSIFSEEIDEFPPPLRDR